MLLRLSTLLDRANCCRNTMTAKDDDDDDDGWVFDTVKAPTMVIPKETLKKKLRAVPLERPDEDPSQMMEDLHIAETPAKAKYPANSTVRRTPTSDSSSPSVKRTTSKRRSSVKQPLGLDLSFGNSPSTVRQFRRVSDKLPEESGHHHHAFPVLDENSSPKTLFSSENNSKEAELGRRAYSKAVGLSCQEVLADTGDQEKREAISRLAEAWSDLEMIDPEGLYHIVKLMNEKLQA